MKRFNKEKRKKLGAGKVKNYDRDKVVKIVSFSSIGAVAVFGLLCMVPSLVTMFIYRDKQDDAINQYINESSSYYAQVIEEGEKDLYSQLLSSEISVTEYADAIVSLRSQERAKECMLKENGDAAKKYLRAEKIVDGAGISACVFAGSVALAGITGVSAPMVGVIKSERDEKREL